MKHVVALALSFVLLLVGVVSPSGALAGGSAQVAACSMDEGEGCAHCVCCLKPADDAAQPLTPTTLPAPDHAGRTLLVAPPLTTVLAVALDSRPESIPFSSAVLVASSVPLYQRHCLLLL